MNNNRGGVVAQSAAQWLPVVTDKSRGSERQRIDCESREIGRWNVDVIGRLLTQIHRDVQIYTTMTEEFREAVRFWVDSNTFEKAILRCSKRRSRIDRWHG